MFNVTVLKMKDILRYFLSILLIVTIIIFIGKQLGILKEKLENGKAKDEEDKIQKVENKIGFLFKNSQLQALDITMPVISNINKEYRDISKEDKEKEEENNNKENILKGML